MNGKQAWGILAAEIIAYEIYAGRKNQEQLLSEIVDEWLTTHPVLTRAIIAAVALHLANGVSESIDPLHHVFALAGRLCGKPDRPISTP